VSHHPRLAVLTQSALGTLQVCEEMFRLRYLERLRPMEEKPYFSIGKGVHAGVEHHSPEAGVRALREARGEPWTDAERRALDMDSAIVHAMVEGALRRWASWPSSPEVPFKLPVINPETGGRSTAHSLGGVIDGVYSTRDHLLELKTSSRVDRDYIARLDIDFQVTTYLAASSELTGRDFREVVYRIIKKPGIRPRKGETEKEYRERIAARKPLAPLKQRKAETDDQYLRRSTEREAARKPLTRKIPETVEEYGERVRQEYLDRPEDYFIEVRVTRTDEDLLRWRWEVWSLHLRVLALEGGAFPVRNTNACLDYGRCTYFDLCTGAVGPEAFRVLTDANPELPRQPNQES